MSKENVSYSLDFLSMVSYNVIRQALLLDRQINWVSFKKTMALRQLMPNWVLKLSHEDDEDFIAQIISNRNRDDRNLGQNDAQLSVFKDLNFETFTETSFRESAKNLGLKAKDIDKLDDVCKTIVETYFIKVNRPVVKVADTIAQIQQLLDEAIVNWTVSPQDALTLGRIYDAIGVQLVLPVSTHTRSITSPDVLYKKIKAVIPVDDAIDYTYPQISGNGTELIHYAKLLAVFYNGTYR